MSDTAAAPAESAPADTGGQLTTQQAAKMLADRRWKAANPEAQEAAPETEQPASAETAAPQETVEQTDAAPPQEAPGEVTQEEAEPALPPIEPPRAWSKEWKQEFATYPRDVQEKLAQREQERDSGLRRLQNEHAEKLKAIENRQQEVDQARARYEEALPTLYALMQSDLQGEFADIKTPEDIERLAVEDLPRWARYNTRQQKLAQVQNELKAAQDQQVTEFKQKWADFTAKEDQLFAEHAPEMADPAKAKQLQDAAVRTLVDLGFTDQELARLWAGEASVSLRDHRIQRLILNSVKLDGALKSAAKPAPKPIPPVQKPGVVNQRQTQASAEMQALVNNFNDRPSARGAAQLIAARRAAQRK